MTQAPVLVLVEPQDLVNIASAVRIAKNFSAAQLRLVKPRVFDPYRIEGIAHNTGEIVAAIGIHETLAEATADCVYAIGLTARGRAAKRQLLRPRAAAELLTAESEDGPVALVFGREDAGLTNDELDRCNALASISTNPEHKSLNLAQAVAIMSYECWNAREGEDQPRKLPRRRAGRAPHAELDRMFHDWERTLWGVDFFKARNPERVMRSLRESLYRADFDMRETKLFRAMALEVVHFLVRKGVELEIPEPLRRPGGRIEGEGSQPEGD